MKKTLGLLIMLLIIGFAFSITFLTDITYNIDVSYASSEIERILTNYGIKVGSLTSEVDIKLALQEIVNLGYFSTVSYNLNEETGTLSLFFTPNPAPEKVVIEYLGDKLIDKKTIQSVITVKENVPINFNELQNSMKNIQNLYVQNGYQFVEIMTNLKINDQGVKLEPIEVNKKKYESNTLVFLIKEYCIWDLDLRGELAQLDKELIKKRINFDFKKDWKKKFFLFRPSAKETYPSVQKIQNIYISLSQIPLFGDDVQVSFEIVEIDENKGGELILVLEGSLRKLIEEEPVFVEEIEFIGNESIQTFRLHEQATKYVNPVSYASNLDLLYAYDAVQQFYIKEGYLYTTVMPEYKKEEQKLIFEIKEAKVGDVEIIQQENAKTQKYIVDSLVKIKPGEPVNQKKLQDTYISFVGTGFFENVEIVPYQQDENIIGFKITPIEKEKLGKLIGGIQWSPPKEKGEKWYKGLTGTLEVQWANPFGYGETFDIKADFLPFKNQYMFEFDFDIIKLFGSNLDLGTNIRYMIHPDEVSHLLKGKDVTNQFQLGISPRYQIYDFSYLTGSLSYNHYKFNDNGTSEVISLNTIDTSIGYVYNTVDSPYRPYNGYYFKVNDIMGFELSAIENNYLGVNLEGKFFKSYYKFTLGSRLRLATVIDEKDLYPDFGVGGFNSVRTYDFYEIEGDAALLLFNTEFVYELAKGDVPLDLFGFFDWGNATDDVSSILLQPIWSFGGGLKITVPMLGQFSFGYGWNKDLKGNFWIGLGQVF
ncbi:MAG TPA: BamA/TamA family outer membrane protein [Defluviitoga sp.]|nr:BamA/TamA family outer membrane protein [Defluviitoga sp.]HOP24246.1 BamA/TamA family outer membrane protein [Defluviitoga sp.]HPZ28162.1 BamA/TamA family outer membrane protein [Defluviitoga sp.]HQD62052.1 BamA/TamA family outer membrane protein [Defluviitoga sp.]